MEILEWIAVFFSVLYLVFAIKQHILCWLCAIISSGIYIYLCFEALLYGEAGIHAFYVFMAVVGWWTWKKEESIKKIKSLGWLKNAVIILAGLFIAGIVGWVLADRTQAAFPYIDSFTTTFSFITTFMVIYRVLENWMYWLVINMTCVYLYASRDLELTAYLYAGYVLMSIYGYWSWRKEWEQQEN